MTEAICVMSGGLDSTVLLYKLIDEGFTVKAISYDYAQKHQIELAYAKTTCDNLGVPHKILDITSIVDIFKGSALTDNIEVPDGHYESDNMKVTVVPNRNSIFLNLAMAYGISHKIYNIAYAAHAGDHAIYPDTRPVFVEKIQALAEVVDYEPLKIMAPFLHIHKEDIVKLGVELGVDFKNTWSCYKGRQLHCGQCGTCAERIESFKLAGIIDPIEYEIDIDWKEV